MTAPVIRQYTDAIPAKGQAQTTFDTNVNDWLDWTTLQFAPDLVAFGSWADQVRAALIAGNLPPLTGRQLDAVRVNAAGNGVEFADVTAAGWALLDDANAAAQLVTLGVTATAAQINQLATLPIAGLTQAQAEDAASEVFGTVSGERLAQAVSGNLNASGSAPMYACRAWVNFNGTGTVAIRASGNVSSITDNGIGDYTVNFTTAMPDTDFAYFIGGNDASLGSANFSYAAEKNGRTTRAVGSLRFGIGYAANVSLYDMGTVSVMVVR